MGKQSIKKQIQAQGLEEGLQRSLCEPWPREGGEGADRGG